LDLLGGAYFEDIDGFIKEIKVSDLNNPNRQVVKGDAYGYNYKYAANVLMLLPSLNFRLIKLISIWRSLFPLRIIKEMDYIKNGIYETISFGKSESF
jgi:hypothetical protein